MSAGDSARQHHLTARSELIQRIQLRDHVLVLFLVAVGTLFGIAFGTSAKPEILLVVPYLTLGAAVVISQHQEIIGSLGSFLHNELHPFLETIDEVAPEWDTSQSLKEYLTTAIWMRTLGHSILLVVPSLAALALNWCHGFVSPFPEGPVWWFGVGFMVLSCLVIYKSHQWRKKIQKSFD